MSHTVPTRYSQVVVDETKDFGRLHQLLLDCIHYPDVADEVRTLVYRRRGFARTEEKNEADTIDHVWTESPLPSILDSLQLGDEKSSWLKALTRWEEPQDAGFGTQEPTCTRYVSSFPEYVAMTLLVLCPNIEHLAYMTGIPNKLDDFLHRNNYGRLPQQYLQTLQQVSVWPERGMFDDTYAPCDPLFLLRSFHHLPNIQSISLRTVEDAEDIGIAFPGTSGLKTIRIEHSTLSSSVVAALIRVPRSLEKLVLTGGTFNSYRGEYFLRPKTVSKALWSQRMTLVELDLDCDRNIFYDSHSDRDEDRVYPSDFEADEVKERIERLMQNEEFKFDETSGNGPLFTHDLPDTREYKGTIGSLHDFVSLKRLSIGMKFLLGQGSPAPFRLVDALPQSLEVLRLRGYKRGDNNHWDEQVEEFLNTQATKLPNLKAILGVEERIASNLDVLKQRPKPYDPRQPKRALTSYFLHANHVRTTLRLQHPDWAPSQISEEVTRRWSALSKEEKNVYEHQYEIDLARYFKQRVEYDAGRPVPEITVEEAEALYEEFLVTGALIPGRKGLRVLQNAVASGRRVGVDVDALEQRILEADERANQEAEKERLRIEGPNFEWILAEKSSSPPGADMSQDAEALETELGKPGIDGNAKPADETTESETSDRSVNTTIRDEL